MTLDRSRLRWNGWGPVDGPDPTLSRPGIWPLLADALALETPLPLMRPASLDETRLSTPLDRANVKRLEHVVGTGHVLTDALSRASRARGKSYPDLLALRKGDASAAPAAVVLPEGAEQILELFRFASETGLKLVPTGGGTSVVGGAGGPARSPWLAVDTSRMDRVLALDETDRTATFGAGIDGPSLEAALNSRGFTLGHFPQSFRHSTLGGWIAASGAGQQSGRYGRPHDWLIDAEVATPAGLWRTEAFPRSAAGPRLGTLAIGSEGAFGIVTRATVRIRRLPARSDYRGYLFADFASGMSAIRTAVQEGVPAAMLRLSDPEETRLLGSISALGRSHSLARRLSKLYLRGRGVGDRPNLLIAGFEGERLEIRAARRAAERHIGKAGGVAVGVRPGRRWLSSRFDGPSLRDPLLDRGIAVDSLETATLWSNLPDLYRTVREALASAIAEQVPAGSRGLVMTHISHSYPEGASLYFTFLFPQRRGEEIEQWRAIKRAASEAIVAQGATISHHHGVGEDHLPWLGSEKGETGVVLLRALKAALDPRGMLNPGKLIP
jgi:alkyldihydroxyacetonephosphate synthase